MGDLVLREFLFIDAVTETGRIGKVNELIAHLTKWRNDIILKPGLAGFDVLAFWPPSRSNLLQ